ncbi:MAG: undecaprenyl/decaprenyl-phosphate alpha-N-acetylglucosaminyl 1-phosphate transferase, partial [Acidobacteria bacterium]|nr:undecaprenyl/decaprenyl-phosphate alpha-N-acetylglucosaminyl 1-phosphate transferase [Acidobacteriota bacterium]
MRTYLALFLISTFASAVLAPLLIAACRRWNIGVDAPDGDRKLHAAAVSRLGGVGIFIAFVAALLAMLTYDNRVTQRFEEISPQLLLILGPALIVFALGVADDFVRLRPRWKFLIQTLAAVLLWQQGFRITYINLPLLGAIVLPAAVGLVVTVLWVVAVTNAFNFIDGMDGLAGGIAFFCTLSVLIMALIQGNEIVPIIAAPMAGAVLGFLPFNWHPARLFMGDGGSYFLGFVLAALAVMSTAKTTTMVAVAVPIALVGIPLLDTALAVFRRFLKGQPLFLADGDHIHHRLLRTGMHPRTVVLLLYLLTVLLGGLALAAMLAGPESWTILIPVLLGLLAVGVVRRLGYKEFDELVDMFQKAARFQRQVIGNQVRMRRFVDEMSHAADVDELLGMLTAFLADLKFDAFYLEVPLRAANGSAVTAPVSRLMHPLLPGMEPSPPSAPGILAAGSSSGAHAQPDPAGRPNSTALAGPLVWQWGTDPLDDDERGESWRVRIPIHGEDGRRGYVYLVRRMEKEKVLFQMASLLD